MTILPSPDIIVQVSEETAQAALTYVRCLRQSLAYIDYSAPGSIEKGHAIMRLIGDIQRTHLELERTDHSATTVRVPAVTSPLNNAR